MITYKDTPYIWLLLIFRKEIQLKEEMYTKLSSCPTFSFPRYSCTLQIHSPNRYNSDHTRIAYALDGDPAGRTECLHWSRNPGCSQNCQTIYVYNEDRKWISGSKDQWVRDTTVNLETKDKRRDEVSVSLCFPFSTASKNNINTFSSN